MHAGDQTVGKENSGNKTVYLSRHTYSSALTSLQKKKKVIVVNLTEQQFFITQKETALILQIQCNHQIDSFLITMKSVLKEKKKQF